MTDDDFYEIGVKTLEAVADKIDDDSVAYGINYVLRRQDDPRWQDGRRRNELIELRKAVVALCVPPPILPLSEDEE
jgi:hypothetical protein